MVEAKKINVSTVVQMRNPGIAMAFFESAEQVPIYQHSLRIPHVFLLSLSRQADINVKINCSHSSLTTVITFLLKVLDCCAAEERYFDLGQCVCDRLHTYEQPFMYLLYC